MTEKFLVTNQSCHVFFVPLLITSHSNNLGHVCVGISLITIIINLFVCLLLACFL
jgi:hypothetical protein